MFAVMSVSKTHIRFEGLFYDNYNCDELIVKISQLKNDDLKEC